MRKITIAFDCDGTLVTTDSADNGIIVANERVRSGLIWLASMKNTKIIVWSGGGEMWARQVVRELGLTKYVDGYADKNYQGKVGDKHLFAPSFAPDIAIDDIQACELGLLNLIVKEK